MFKKDNSKHVFRLHITNVDNDIFNKLTAFAEKLTKINPNVQVEVDVEGFEIGLD